MLDEDGVRDFTSQTPGTRLVGDITYLRTGEGWLYLATVIDLCTGMVIGWAMAEHMQASLCTAALRMARDHGYLADGEPSGSDQSKSVVFHSDRGTQGGFNRLSQHLKRKVFDGETTASCRSCAASEDAFTWPVGFPAAG